MVGIVAVPVPSGPMWPDLRLCAVEAVSLCRWWLEW